jgi:perosamine synthetase
MKTYNLAGPVFSGLEKKYLLDCLKSTWISSQGKYLERFEKTFAKFCRRRYASATTNGTVSLHLILLALGIKAGDEVIVPNFTYVAAANAVLYTGAKPILVDCEPKTYNIDPDKIEKSITKKTKAVIAVHLYGNPCEMDKILKIGKKHKLYIIEDAAEAHGALYKNKPVGSFGIASSFSFFGNKTITTGEGGIVVTDSAQLYQKINLLKNQGQHQDDPRYYHRVMGYNYRLTNLQAAIGLAQLKNANKLINAKNKINRWYKKYLTPVVEKKIIAFQQPTPSTRPSYWMTAVQLLKFKPELLAKKLKPFGIQTRPFFVPLNRLPYIKTAGRYPASESLHQQGLILPSASELKEKDIQFISHKIIKILTK